MYIDSTTMWWVSIHVLAILGQFSVFAVGLVAFIFGRGTNFDHFPSHDEFWDDAEATSTLPWAGSALGAFTTFLSIVLFGILWKADTANRSSQFPHSRRVFRKLAVVNSVIISLIAAADIGLAVEAGRSGRNNGLCVTAAIGG
ncbi:hypothetical protein F5B20DRAFT_562795 [Whalleya microplaca]|nr:hypothetical protein F5B20DRAFT_562795 [Whalleya microplaca]